MALHSHTPAQRKRLKPKKKVKVVIVRKPNKK